MDLSELGHTDVALSASSTCRANSGSSDGCAGPRPSVGPAPRSRGVQMHNSVGRDYSFQPERQSLESSHLRRGGQRAKWMRSSPERACPWAPYL